MVRSLLSSIVAPLQLAVLLFLLEALGGCDVERRKSDAELRLNPQQASGHHIYDQYCDRCRSAYSSRGRKGPSLKGVFKRPFLGQSGLPATRNTTAIWREWMGRVEAVEYRAKWSLPADYPMVAPNYAAARSALAKTMGLGRKPKEPEKPAPAKRPRKKATA